MQRHARRLRVLLSDCQAARRTVLSAAVIGDAPQNTPQPLRQGIGQALVPQDLRGNTQMQRRRVSLALVRRRFAHVSDQGGLQFRRLLKTPERGTLHARVDERGQNRVVAGDA